MDSVQKASESGIINEESHENTPIISRIFSSNSAQRQNYQKLSSPRIRDSTPGAGTTLEQSQLPRLDMRQPDIRLIIPPRPPAGQQTAELPKPSTPLGGYPMAGSPRVFTVSVDEDSSDGGEQKSPRPSAANLRFRSAAHAVRLTRMHTRSRLQEPVKVLPSPRRASADQATPRFGNRATPGRSGPLEKSPRSNVPKSGPISTSEEDPFKDDDILPDEDKPDRRMSCLLFVQLVVMILLLAGVIVTAVVQPPRNDRWLDLAIWKWLLLALVLISGRYIASWLVKLLVRIIERNFLLKNRVLYFVYGLRKSVANCLWLAQVLIVWFIFYDPKSSSARKLDIISKILICLQITSALAVCKVLLVKVAANGFHRRAYFERIQEALFRQFLLEQLSQPSSVVATQGSGEALPEGDSGEAQNGHESSLKRGFGSEVQNWVELQQERKPGNMPERATAGTEPDVDGKEGGVRQELRRTSSKKDGRSSDGSDGPNRSDSPHQPGNPHVSRTMSYEDVEDVRIDGDVYGRRDTFDDSPHSLRSVRVPTPGNQVKSAIPIEAQKLQYLTSDTVSAYGLKKLVKFVRSTKIKTYSSIISHQDDSEISSEFQAKAVARRIFRNVASPGQNYLTEDDLLRFLDEPTAERALGMFEGAERGRITKQALISWVVGIYKERKALALSLSDTKTVVAKLHWVLDVILAIFLAIIYLLVFNISATRLLVIISTWFLPATFIFGTTAKDTFVSLVFLFVRHPFSVGDRIQVDSAQYIVEEMNIMDTTLLQTSDNAKVYYPNDVLAGKPILNFYRSPDQSDSWDFTILAKTPVEKLGAFKERMLAYVESLPQLFYPKVSLNVKEIEDSGRMKMGLGVQHRINFQEMGERNQRRTKLILYAHQQLMELGMNLELGPTTIKLHSESLLQLANTDALVSGHGARI